MQEMARSTVFTRILDNELVKANLTGENNRIPIMSMIIMYTLPD
jgi:hypothetical protein